MTHVLDDPDVVVAALHPLRRRLLAHLGRPDSAVGLARRLGLPRQKVNYHLRALEDLGLVEEVERRPRRGLTERIMARRHDRLLIDPDVLDGPLAPVDRAGLAAAAGAGADLVRQAAAVARDAAGDGRRVASATVDSEISLPDPAAFRAFLDELAALLARHDRPDVDGAMRFRATTVVLPNQPVLPNQEARDDR